MRFNYLNNFVDLNKADTRYLRLHPRTFSVFMDSGAFVATTRHASVNLEYHTDWLKQNQDWIDAYALLDVIGDPAASFRNYEYQLKAGLEGGIVTHTPGMDLKKDLDRLCEYSDYIAVGGWTSYTKYPKHIKAANLARLRAVVDACRERGKKVHLFGVADLQLALDVAPDSFDFSVSFASAVKVGMFDERRMKFTVFNPAGRWPRNCARMAREDGVTIEHVKGCYDVYTAYHAARMMSYFKEAGITYYYACSQLRAVRMLFTQLLLSYRRYGREMYRALEWRPGQHDRAALGDQKQV